MTNGSRFVIMSRRRIIRIILRIVRVGGIIRTPQQSSLEIRSERLEKAAADFLEWLKSKSLQW
jgi:hypothetical protein